MNHPNEPEGRRGLAQARAALTPRRRPVLTVVEAAREQARAERPDRPGPEAVDLA